MLFSTPLFLFLFFPFALLVFCCSPQKFKNPALLFLSLLFFFWGEPIFTLVVLCSAVVDWLIVRKMESCQHFWRKKLALLAVVENIAILFYYKYTNFFFDNINFLLHYEGFSSFSIAKVLLPIGVSFIVFEKITYIVDVYKHIGRPADRLMNYLTYIFLFPKLLAGPIVKYHEIEDQLKHHETKVEDIYQGLVRFIVGLGKKVFIADTLAELVDAVFAVDPGHLSIYDAWLGAFCFTLQIYFDFSGYSDMAIGMARIFGFRLKENFQFPYISQNFTEFWRRWHISLSTWIREYIYIPLGGNRVSRMRMYGNLIVAFLLSGIWHGANWTFILWGIYHGLFLLADRIFLAKIQQILPVACNVLGCFFFLVLGWVLFRSPDIFYAGAYFSAMFGQNTAESLAFIYKANHIYFLLLLAVILVFLPAKYSCQQMLKWREEKMVSFWLEPVALLLLAVLAFAKIATTTYHPFLYFRF